MKKIIQSLCSYDYALKLNAYAKANGIVLSCHCKVDTGMNRTGVLYQKEEKNFDQIQAEYQMSNLSVEGIFSHFPVSDDLSSDSKAFTCEQIRLFREVLSRLKELGIDPGLTHIQNSYGILNYGDLGFDYCRPGLLYMGVTSDDQVPILSKPKFQAILSLYANVSVVKTLQKGMTVSYGRHYRVEKPTKVATISIGYADGLPRLASNQDLKVLIHGKACPIIGNICMDQCMVDVTEIENVQEGDVVCLIGMQGDACVTVDEITRKAHTINNETLCALATRVPRLKKRG